jgi:hypothetical protein
MKDSSSASCANSQISFLKKTHSLQPHIKGLILFQTFYFVIADAG